LGAPSDEKTGLEFTVQSLIDPSHAEPVTIIYCLIWNYLRLEDEYEQEVEREAGTEIHA
jgi:hypothetical protein